MEVHVDINRLKELYVTRKKSIPTTAKALGVSPSALLELIKSEGIRSGRTSKLDPVEIRRQYVDEDRSIPQIAEKFGVSMQAIRFRLIQIGVERRRTNTRRKETLWQAVKKTLDLDNIRHLYIDQHLSVEAISRKIGIPSTILMKIIKSEGIKIRPHTSYVTRKYPQIYALRLGESVVMPLPKTSQPLTRLYSTATKAKIKITVKTVAPGLIKVTRLS